MCVQVAGHANQQTALHSISRNVLGEFKLSPLSPSPPGTQFSRQHALQTNLRRCSLLCMEGDSTSSKGSQATPAAYLAVQVQSTHHVLQRDPESMPALACHMIPCLQDKLYELLRLPPRRHLINISSMAVGGATQPPVAENSCCAHLANTPCKPGPPTVR